MMDRARSARSEDSLPSERPARPSEGGREPDAEIGWWGNQWINSLKSMSYGYATRLDRGLRYFQRRRVHDVSVGHGAVKALVTGTQEYRVAIRPIVFPEAVWSSAIRSLAAESGFAAQLLAGEMPADIERAFADTQTSLFPLVPNSIQTECTCSDWGQPCKHVAAVQYVIARRIDLDPFVLFLLRGRNKEQLQDALRKARTSGAIAPSRPAEADVERVRPQVHTEVAFDRWNGPSPTLVFPSADEPGVSLLQLMGPPPSWGGLGSFQAALSPMLTRASKRGQDLLDHKGWVTEAPKSRKKTAAAKKT